jgi:MarR family transcriptional repressor of emrRAB
VHAAYGEAWAPIGKAGLADATRDLSQLHQHLAALGASES